MTGALVLAMLGAYLAGSIPTAYLVGRVNGIDLRAVGSGNLGATNVFRALGWKWGLLVYVVDLLKGVSPVLWFPAFAAVPVGWPWGVVFGILAIVGHVRPVFLLGRGGGKGVATASGVFLALTPVPALWALASFAVVVAATRYVSLGSLVGALALPVVLIWRERGLTPLGFVSIAVSAFVFWTHRDNIRRLRRGEERRVERSSHARA